MTKIVLDQVSGGYNLSTINNNFDLIEAELNDKVLYRNNVNGEPNSMGQDLDLNGFNVINVNRLNANDVLLDNIPLVDYIEGVAAGTIDVETVDLRRQKYVANSDNITTVVLTRPHTGSEVQILVIRNGVVQDKDQYTVVDETHISFSLPLSNGEVVEFVYFNTIVGLEGPQGPQGIQGNIGPQGIPGPTGAGVIFGGIKNQVLAKVDSTDFNTYWKTEYPINAADYGVVGDGVTDDLPALQAAINAASAGGFGAVSLDGINKLYLNGDLAVNTNVLLYVTAPPCNITTDVLTNRDGQLIIAPGFSVKLGTNSGIRGLLIKSTFLTDATQQTADIALWAGTGVTITNFTSDVLIEDCTIVGFNRAISTEAGVGNVQHIRINRTNIDCVNGVFIEKSVDVSYFNEVHCWPFASVASTPEANNVHLLRSGTAFYFGTPNDWLQIKNCFNYGYKTGFHTDGSGNITFVNCGADYEELMNTDGSIGFKVTGSANEPTFIGCQTAGRTYGFYLDNTSPQSTTVISGCSSWQNGTSHIYLIQGEAIITGMRARGGAVGVIGIRVDSTATKCTVTNSNFRNLTKGLSLQANTIKVYQRDNTYTTVTTLYENLYKPTIASAAPLTLDGESTFWDVTGTTNFGTLDPAASYTGKVVTLKFNGTLSVFNGASMKLSGGVDFAATANDTLSLVSDGTTWYEVGRAVLT